MTNFTTPTSPAEQAALDVWNSVSADTTGMLLAVRRALAVQREGIAQAIEAELVCCDIYERLQKEPRQGPWRTEATKGHHLCYWGAASAAIAREYGKD